MRTIISTQFRVALEVAKICLTIMGQRSAKKSLILVEEFIAFFESVVRTRSQVRAFQGVMQAYQTISAQIEIVPLSSIPWSSETEEGNPYVTILQRTSGEIAYRLG